MNEHQTDELIVTDVDEWLGDDELHAACAACVPSNVPGTLVIAYCGTLYRLKNGVTGLLPGVCETCRSVRHNHRCGA